MNAEEEEKKEEEKSKGFKVDDRRRFSAEGELKPQHRDDAEAADKPAASPAGASAAASQTAQTQGAGTSAAAASMHREPTAEISFETFVVGLSTQALVHLGEIPDPQNLQADQDLPAAQQLIDIIGMLKEKTRGNLGQQEQSLLDAILFELRMKYVERKRQASR